MPPPESALALRSFGWQIVTDELTEFFERNDADVRRVLEPAGLGPGFGHANEMRSNSSVHVGRVGVADTGEYALVGTDHGRDDGCLAILLVGYLDQLRANRSKPILVSQGQDTRVCDDLLFADLASIFVMNIDLGGERCVTAVTSH